LPKAKVPEEFKATEDTRPEKNLARFFLAQKIPMDFLVFLGHSR